MNAILFLCRHIDLNLPESPLIQIISYFLTAALLFSQRSVRICYLRPHPKLVIVRSAAVLWFLAVSIFCRYVALVHSIFWCTLCH